MINGNFQILEAKKVVMNICRLGSTGLYPLIPQLTMCETKNLEKRVRV